LTWSYASPEQAIVARHHFRPRDAEISRRYQDRCAKTSSFRVDDLGGWPAVQQKHFVVGALFVRFYVKR
jgi:ABC-type sulfate transport system substrate-binding protein